MSNKNLFISPCCKSFIVNDGIIIRCSSCNKSVGELKEDDITTVNVCFNNESINNISIDMVENYIKNATRLSRDETYELSDTKCPKCKNLSRYSRDPQGNLIFICSKCRNVFYI